jgi:AcrR family transcriptional regulator
MDRERKRGSPEPSRQSPRPDHDRTNRRGGGPRPTDAAADGYPGPGLARWPVDPDSLWPDFGAPPPPNSQAARHEQQRAMLHQQKASRHPQSRIRPRLTRDEIIDAAIAVADAEGAEALSMRRIAQVLRSGTMSLYWHVASKDRLLDLMQDVVMGEIGVPEPSGDWRADMRDLAVSSRAMMHRHPWLIDFVGGRPPLGPHTLLSLERALGTLAGLRLEPTASFDILTAVQTYVSGTVLREVQEIRVRQAEDAAATGAEMADVMARRARWRDRLAATGMFPHFVAFLDEGIDPDAAETMEERFSFGLDCLLDGIAARIKK